MTNLTNLYFWLDLLVPLGLILFLTNSMFRHIRVQSLKQTFIILASCLLFLFLVRHLFSAFTNPVIKLLFYFIPIRICACLMIHCLYMTPIPVTLFCYFLIKNFIDITQLLARSLQSHIYNYWPPANTQIGFVLIQFLALSILLPSFLLYIKDLLAPLIELDAERCYWRFMCIIPISNYVVYFLGIAPLYPPPGTFPVNRPIPLLFFWVLGSFVTYVMLTWMLKCITENTLKIHTLERETLCHSIEQKQREKMQRQYHEIKQIRQEVRQHMQNLLQYLESNNQAEMKNYLDHYQKSTEFYSLPLCEIPSVNAIASYYLHLAEKNQVHLEYNLQLTKALPVPEQDFCILLSNLLENALEACLLQKSFPRFIRAKASQKGTEMLFLTIENSYEQQVQIKDGHFLSSKHKGAGIGTSSIRSIANHYGGEAKFTYDGKVFKAHIYLNHATRPANSNIHI